jgi:hypothetical protein
MKHLVKKWLVALVFLSIANTSFAIGDGPYFGIDIAYTNLNNKSRAVPTPNGQIVSPNNTGVGARLFVGDILLPYFGFEFGLTRYASSQYKARSGDTGNIHTSSFDIEGVPMLPLPKVGITVFGKIGIAYLRSVQSRKLTPQGDSANNSGAHPLIGFGAAYDLTQSVVLDLEVTRVISRSNALPSPNMIALGLAYHVTDHYCGQFLC